MNADLENVVVGTYFDENGDGVAGIHTTTDPSCSVIYNKVLKKLLSDFASREELLLEEAEKKYGDIIIDKFLDAHGMLSEFGERCLPEPKAVDEKKDIYEKVAKANVEKGKYNQAVIIRGVLEGLTKQEIESNFGFSRPTINKAVNDLTQQDFEDIWNKYRDTVFDGLSMDIYKGFINFDCDHKKWQYHLAAQNDFARQKKENEVREKQIAIERAREKAMSGGVATVDSIIGLFGSEEV